MEIIRIRIRFFSSDGLPVNLGRGPTPRGESFRSTRRTLDVVDITAGSNADTARNTTDDNELSDWSSDGEPNKAWIRYELAQPQMVDQVVLKLIGWRTQTYPLEISIDDKVVYTGTTMRSLGYVTISFPPKFKVTIEPGTLPEPNGEDVFPLDPETGELRLAVKVADQSIACRVEPLAPGGLQMPEEYLKRLLLDGAPIELGTTTVGNQSVTIREARLAYSAMLASFELVNPVVRFVGNGDSATAGSQALVGLSITYDLGNNRARIVRLPPPEKK